MDSQQHPLPPPQQPPPHHLIHHQHPAHPAHDYDRLQAGAVVPQHGIPQSLGPLPPGTQRPQVTRNARACTVCRAVKMKCVGAEDGLQPCQRCKRSNLQCIFEKHRRGRKPGSKLSDTSKMLRRIDKAPSDPSTTNDTQQHQNSPPQQIAYQQQSQPHQQHPQHYDAQGQYRQDVDPRLATAPVTAPAPLPGIHHLASTAAHLPPVSSYGTHQSGRLSPSRHFQREPEPRPDVRMYEAPSAAHRERNTFFGTVLAPRSTQVAHPDAPGEHAIQNGVDPSDARSAPAQRSSVVAPPRYGSPAFTDPLSAGILSEVDAANLLDLIFQRLNGFLMLFDPSLHTLAYIRKHSPFLLTCILAVACKFWRPEAYPACLELVNAYIPLAFDRGWRSPEVVQAFLFLTFYPEVGQDRTWTFIGYASRMAIELGMHRVGGGMDLDDTSIPEAERRNRERTFLVLFVQERTWAALTARQSMLLDSDLVRSATVWHAQSARMGGPTVNDVMLCAIVELRRLAMETHGHCKSRSAAMRGHIDVDSLLLLEQSNNKLSDWMELWHTTLQRAGGQMFHFSTLCIYRLQTRLQLHGLSIEAALVSRQSGLGKTIERCWNPGLSALLIPHKELAPEKVLRKTDQLDFNSQQVTSVFREAADRHESVLESVAQTAQAYASEENGQADAAQFFRALLESELASKASVQDDMDTDPRPATAKANGHHHVKVSYSEADSRTPSPEPMPMRAAFTPAASSRPAFVQNPAFEFPASPDIPACPFALSVSERAGSEDSHRSSSASSAIATAELISRPVAFWRTLFTQLGFGQAQLARETS
ncbi:fungal-specific transcription factor domain-containing protein [Auriculariales sp. MPI-PUGE-AT-0066]|nr:fungal-specific transcription factor domain-containing protein [Auriculariales sp. MPI-PUGE-AT-0066]